jgi:hypothetical protein
MAATGSMQLLHRDPDDDPTLPDSDGLVLAADVLANSLNYLFKHRDADALYGPLNCVDAVAGHPLAAHLDAFFARVFGFGSRSTRPGRGVERTFDFPTGVSF